MLFPDLFDKIPQMLKVTVKLTGKRDDSYDIHIKAGILDKIAEYLPKSSHYAIVSDDNVGRIYGAKLSGIIKKTGAKCSILTFKAGEKSKSRKTKENIENALFSGNFGRDGCIIACGGGVTGDLAGFVAATYMRGIPYVQVPTSLLAMVDSSVGGKTAVDVPAGKNLVGAFHQPKAVIIDPLLLKTLPKRQLRSGFAEVIKHAVLADAKFFLKLYENADRLYDLSPSEFEEILAKNCAIKASVVSRDEKEGNLRQVLNYGHTVGHAVEKLSGYRVLHGEAVAVGMAYEGAIAVKMGILQISELDRQNDLLRRVGFNISSPRGVRAEEIIEAMRSDKKVRAEKIKMALPERIGKMHKSPNGKWVVETPEKIVRETLFKSM